MSLRPANSSSTHVTPPPPNPATAPSAASGSATGSSWTITVQAWSDPLVDEIGHDPRSAYVETFWLGVLGPTATWLMRRFAAGLDHSPRGYQIDLAATAAAMGLGFRTGRQSAFTKALQRCVMFGLAHQLADGGYAIRRRLPPVAHRHLRRLPEDLQQRHAEWMASAGSLDEFTRAHRLALTMIEVGDDPQLVEHQLGALGITANVAAQVADNAAQLAQSSATSSTTSALRR